MNNLYFNINHMKFQDFTIIHHASATPRPSQFNLPFSRPPPPSYFKILGTVPDFFTLRELLKYHSRKHIPNIVSGFRLKPYFPPSLKFSKTRNRNQSTPPGNSKRKSLKVALLIPHSIRQTLLPFPLSFQHSVSRFWGQSLTFSPYQDLDSIELECITPILYSNFIQIRNSSFPPILKNAKPKRANVPVQPGSPGQWKPTSK